MVSLISKQLLSLILRKPGCSSMVFTYQTLPVILSSFTLTAALYGRCIILLTPVNLEMFVFARACPEESLATRPAGNEVVEALLSPDNIYFNILCMDSVWTQPLTLLPCPRACCRPSSWVHADLWTLPHLWGPATDPSHRLHRTKEHKMESCPSLLVTPGGVLYCEKLTSDNEKVSAVVFLTYGLYELYQLEQIEPKSELL